MKKTPGQNMIVSKPALRYIIRALPEQSFKIRWKHKEDYSILNIIDYESKKNSEATFIKGDNLIFQHLKSSNPKVIAVFEKILGVSLGNHSTKSYHTLYLEVDYHLMELYEFLQANDRIKIEETKAKIFSLRENILALQTNKEPCDDNISIN